MSKLIKFLLCIVFLAIVVIASPSKKVPEFHGKIKEPSVTNEAPVVVTPKQDEQQQKQQQKPQELQQPQEPKNAPVITGDDVSLQLLKYVTNLGISIGKLQLVRDYVDFTFSESNIKHEMDQKTAKICAFVLYHQLRQSYNTYKENLSLLDKESKMYNALIQFDQLFRETLEKLNKRFAFESILEKDL